MNGATPRVEPSRRRVLPWRAALAALLVLGAVATVALAWRHYNAPVTLRIAVVPGRQSEPLVIEALAQWLQAHRRRTRLTMVEARDEATATAMVLRGQAEWASVRGDFTPPPGLTSLLSLYPEVAVVVAPAVGRKPITEWSQLKRRTIAVFGSTQVDDPLLRKLLQSHGLTDVKLVKLEREALQGAVARGEVQAVARVAPLPGSHEHETGVGRTLRHWRGAATVLGLDDAEAIAKADNRYLAVEVPAGALRPAPPLPLEAVDTLGVLREWVLPTRVPQLAVQRALGDIMDAKRALAVDEPLVRQIGAPDLDKAAAIKAHGGAVSYFGGEEIALADVAMEWLYVVPFVLGGLGAAGTFLARLLWPPARKRARETLLRALQMRREASAADSVEALDRLDGELEPLHAEIVDAVSRDDVKERMVVSLLVASDAIDRAVAQRRKQLGRQASAAAAPADR